MRRKRIVDCLMAVDGPVPAETIIRAVYGDDPPPGALGSIRNAICLARSDGEQIHYTIGRGYTIIKRGKQ